MSLLQTVFSKKSAETIQYYFGKSRSATQSQVGSAYRIRKHGLAFVQSRASKYLSSKSEQIYSVVSSASSTGSSTKRNLFSFQLNDIVKIDSSKSKKNLNTTLDGDDDDDTSKEVKAVISNGDIFGLPSWAKGLGSTKELSRIKTPTDESSDNKNSNSFDIDDKKSNGEESRRENVKPSAFPLASLINVEALLMASGQLPSNSEEDPGASLVADMLSQSVSYKVTPAPTKYGKEDQIEIVKMNDDKNDESALGPRSDLALSTEFMLNQATQKLEAFLNEATASFSQDRLQALILSATRSLAVDQNADVLKSTFDNIVATAENIARDQGVDVSEAAAQARATTKFTTDFLRVANGVLLSGFVKNDMNMNIDENQNLAKQMKISLDTTSAKPLFHRFDTVQGIPSNEFHHVSKQGAIHAKLAGAIYQDTIPTIHGMGHSLVANGTSADVKWMVTDSIGYDSDFESAADGAEKDSSPTLIRTITIRGFDASDEEVDRERLVTEICNAGKVPISDDFSDVQVHRGLFSIAKSIYEDIKPFIDLASPMHKIVLTGHSIGGALANLILMLMAVERGNNFVNDKVKRVFTFGSPPIAKAVAETNTENSDGDDSGMYVCSVLETLGLPANIVFGFVEPWVSLSTFICNF